MQMHIYDYVFLDMDCSSEFQLLILGCKEQNDINAKQQLSGFRI